ncbi:MAG: nitrite reductase small subunit NirD [Verrucomicrobiota bacterium]
MSETLENATWINAGSETNFPEGLGICIKHEEEQIAVFNFNGDDWFAVQNLCPHDNQMVLSRGLTGTQDGQPKIACPLHKRAFNLRSGKFMGEGQMSCLKTYPLKRENGHVFLAV